MTLVQNTLEGGTAGSAITIGNSGGASGSAFSEVGLSSGTETATYTSDAYRYGTLAAALAGGTNAGNVARISYTTLNGSVCAVRFFIKFNPLPSLQVQVFNVRSAAATTAILAISPTNKFQLQNAASVSIFNSANALLASTWYRVEIEILALSATVGQLNFRYYLGDDTTPVETQYTGTGLNLGTANMTTFRFGRLNGAYTAGPIIFDNIAINDATSTPIGPMYSGVSKTSAVSWATRASVTPATCSVTWPTRSSVGQTASNTWATRAPIVATDAVTWSTRGTTSKSNAITWATRSGVVASDAVSWATRARVAASDAVAWSTRASVSVTDAVSWATRKSITATDAVSWGTRGSVSRTAAVSWGVRGGVASSSAVAWAVRGQLATALSNGWSVRARVGASRSISWAARQIVEQEFSNTWAVDSNLITAQPYRATSGAGSSRAAATEGGAYRAELLVSKGYRS